MVKRITRRAAFMFTDGRRRVHLIQTQVRARRRDDFHKSAYEIDLEVEEMKLIARLQADRMMPTWWDERSLVGVLIADIDGMTPGRIHYAENVPELSEREELLAKKEPG